MKSTTICMVLAAMMRPLLALSANTTNATNTTTVVNGDPYSECTSEIRDFDPFTHKEVYQVGVHAIRGFDAAVAEYTGVFADYLTATAGHRFNPPIEFEVVPLSYEDIFTAMDNDDLDFLYSNPGIYSCIGTEVGASPVATIVSRLEVRGHTYELDVFGGVMAVRADNDEIESILDFKNKIVAAGGISMILAGQVQFYEMQKAGLSYVNDPKQVVFTGDQYDVVNGVLSGEFDVGFVRTDTIERTTDENGELIDPDLFKIIEPKIFLMEDGNLFPFLHSTDIYPEWPVSALTTVPQDVFEEVQAALLSIGSHADAGQAYAECVTTYGQSHCDAMAFPEDFVDSPRCDTTKAIAEVAYSASLSGSFAGFRFRSPRSYFEVRSMQQDAGFMELEGDGQWRCTRPSNVYDDITCPEGYYKNSLAVFEQSCEQVGLSCGEGYDCFCKPCVKAFEVDVYPFEEGDIDFHLEEYFGEDIGGCDKMSICGETEQNTPITFRAYDNRQREDAMVTVLFHAGDDPVYLDVTPVSGTFAYEFTISQSEVGVEVFEVFIDGEQIPQSPLRVEIIDRDCSMEGNNREADESGNCVCSSNTYEMSGTCVESAYFFVMIIGCVLIVLLLIMSFYLANKRKQNDSVWHINVDELVFSEPPEVVGRGAFGIVILGQYRGTKVAVKRVMPPSMKEASPTSGHRSSTKSLDDGNAEGTSSGKNVRFGGGGNRNDEHDIEAQYPNARDSLQMIGSKKGKDGTSSNSGRQSQTLENLILPGSGKFDSVLRVLESATLSNHGESTDKFLGRDSTDALTTHTNHGWLPDFLRFDDESRARKEFIEEMRLLSRLRHPCITTVMGAVVAPTVDPMLVMEYMEYGSVYDLLHNDTMYCGGEIILQIVRDVAQGINFLHSSKPPILHGD
eukprot:Nitzschia sp. Nitz4//scaffold542_size5954//2//2866//NITZ4_009184-RA/size5954-augustus-gene-0.0-mRNA-1//-1//CDS//3329554268//8049//frame0